MTQPHTAALTRAPASRARCGADCYRPQSGRRCHLATDAKKRRGSSSVGRVPSPTGPEPTSISRCAGARSTPSSSTRLATGSCFRCSWTTSNDEVDQASTAGTASMRRTMELALGSQGFPPMRIVGASSTGAHFRFFPKGSRQYEDNYPRRADQEASNRQLKDTLWQRRAGSYGKNRGCSLTCPDGR